MSNMTHTRRNQPSEWVLWGQHASYGERPIRIVHGTLARCRQEKAWRGADGGWSDLAIRGAAR